ncbi:hypothetical protein A3742_02635 [Oleiphilus sp. HI0071]|nr:hypothetical protein A3737_09045 [Oleiphilus sp. HI0065]KZY78439.1 hypothetical protein A3742_02635 [Oleiphilus sp. HI0071]KZY93149.1 hypothetical protein A3744_14115 [Oleiphilus sp. HI0073]KZZ13902.1 hypothetical protein A3750_02720 [Oleiphilus sp. HI0079]KZZ47942.1 hypothetical protein A3760_15635 [Oleiphilus sp. HI0122]KZZ77938.1 hypothetical protein A3767_14065 [Oleiphilus sp. HI0133]
MVQDFLFVILFFVIPFLFSWIMNKIGYPVTRLSIPSFTFVSMILLGYAGYFLLYFQLIDYRVAIGIERQDLVLTAWMASSFTIVSMVLGFFLFARAFATSRLKPNRSVFINELLPFEHFALFVLLTLSLLVLLLYLVQIPKVALLVSIMGGGEDSKFVRSEMGNNFSGKYHWYSLFMHDVAKLVAFSFFAQWRLTKKKLAGFMFFLSFLLVAFSTLMATEKAPFAWFILGLFLVHTIVKNRGRIRVGGALFSIGLMLAFLILAYQVFMGSGDALAAVQHAFSRALTGSTGSSYFYLEFVPDQQGFLLGRSFPNPAGILPFEHFRLTVELMQWRFPAEARSGIVGSSPSVFWTELYANFGWFGLLIPAVFVGFMLAVLDFFVNTICISPIVVGLNVWLLLHFKSLATSGISNYIVDMPLWVLVALVLLITLMCRRKLGCRSGKTLVVS